MALVEFAQDVVEKEDVLQVTSNQVGDQDSVLLIGYGDNYTGTSSSGTKRSSPGAGIKRKGYNTYNKNTELMAGLIKFWGVTGKEGIQDGVNS